MLRFEKIVRRPLLWTLVATSCAAACSSDAYGSPSAPNVVPGKLPANLNGPTKASVTAPSKAVAVLPIHFNGRVEKLALKDGGPGLLVCEPVLKTSGGDFPHLSRGCAAWLQLFVGGQPQCGKTPFWKSLRRIQLELGRQDLRLNSEAAGKVAKMLGVTHVALGTIEGTSKKCTLTYQLYKTPSMQAIGEPIKISGTESELANQMPRLAAQFCNDMEISPEHLPDTPPSQVELVLAGKVQSRREEKIDKKISEELLKLSNSSALAGFLSLDTTLVSDPYYLRPVSLRIVQQEPTNALIFAEFGWVQARLLQFSAGELAKNVKNYPNNYLIKTATVYFLRAQKDGKSELDISRQCVQLAPNNPDSWLTLGQSYCNRGDRIRKGRFYADLSTLEKKEFDETYPLWLGCAEQALRIDPLFGRAWLRASTAAAYAGFLEEADLAFDKTIQLEHDRYNVYWWGLQLYQPKWLSNPGKLKMLALAAARDLALTDAERHGLTRTIAAYPELQKIVLRQSAVTK